MTSNLAVISPGLLTYAAALIGGYLLGSIPFGVLATRMAGIDIRSIGSGNIGATNVLRTGRKDLAAMTFIGDTGKGAAAVGLALLITLALHLDIETRRIAMALAGSAAFLGHLFPIWLKFKGGKGVATFLGTLVAACWPMGLIAGALWLLTAFVFRISSLSALMAAALVVPVSFLLPFVDPPYAFMGMALFMAVLIYIRHADNIRRLLKGEEPKIGKKKDAQVDAAPDA